jgi:hypothetical protein
MGESASSDEQTTVVTATVAGAMPNMARTLLLNADGCDRPDPSFYGEEYISPYFTSVSIPHGVTLVRNALFGTNPDTAGMNYSVWQYMRILHSTEYAEYVTALDTRITYLSDRSLLDYTYGPVTQPEAGLQFVGDPGLGAADGRLRAAWNLNLSGASVTVQCLTTPRLESFSVTVEDGLTSFVPMVPYNDYQVRIDTTAGLSSWNVEYLSKPGEGMDLVTRASAVDNVGASAYETLFPHRSPYSLFRQLWEEHPHLPYKLSGALLALIYLTNEYRSGTANA